MGWGASQEEIMTEHRHLQPLQVSRFGHGKTHACVRASMTVADRVPEGLQVRDAVHHVGGGEMSA